MSSDSAQHERDGVKRGKLHVFKNISSLVNKYFLARVATVHHCCMYLNTQDSEKWKVEVPESLH